MTVDLQRRRVFQSAVAGGALSLGAFVPTPVSAAVARAAADIEVMTWSGCAVNCGSRCQLRVFSKNGRVIRIETDASGDASASTIDGGCTQIRACQRGRSMRQRIYAPERLKFPMKRVGRRGEGRFERISWEQALDEIAARLKDTIDRHTNESVMIMHGSGNQALVNSSAATYRFFNMIGGSLAWYSDYSTACIQNAWPYLYGRFDYGGVRSKAAGQGSFFSQVKNAKLYVTFGNNPAVTRASGGGQSWEFFSAARRNGTRMVFIDPIYSDTMAGRNAEWIPIRPGTDAALCEAIAYVLITENLVDKAFIDRYTIGYDEDSLPASAKPGSSYRSHILGLGPDKTPKTPERAAGITNVPAERIVRLARDMAAAKSCFISQGWAPQRRMNGETQSTSIAMLPILLGQIGLPGTNSGAREGDSYGLEAGLPTGANPVKVGMPVFLWPQAVVDAASLTAETAAVRGAPALRHNIKFIWNTQSNTLINQHGGINQLRPILEDETKVETIVCVDTQMTPSAMFADYVLPDVCHQESIDLMADSYAVGDQNYLDAQRQGDRSRVGAEAQLGDHARARPTLRLRGRLHRGARPRGLGAPALRRGEEEPPRHARLGRIPQDRHLQVPHGGRQRDRHGGLPQGSRQASARDPERQDRDLFRTSCRDRPHLEAARGQGTGDSSDPALRADGRNGSGGPEGEAVSA